jgi:hypothetical protein
MKEATSASAPRVPSGRGGQARPGRDLGEGASALARKRAAAILEVLAGARTPTAAAEALAVSLPRYYLLEQQALHGILVACEPRDRGRGPSAASALAALRSECEQLRRECARQQALVRAAQRAIGLPPPPVVKPERNGTKRRRRRPVARALRAAARLQTEAASAAAASPVVSGS